MLLSKYSSDGGGHQRARKQAQPRVGRRHRRQISALRKPAPATRAAADGLRREVGGRRSPSRGTGGWARTGSQTEPGPPAQALICHPQQALWGGQGALLCVCVCGGGVSCRDVHPTPTTHTPTPGQWLGLKGPASSPAPSLDLFDKFGFCDTCGLRMRFCG